ncbi:MAG TPA: UbiA family prenyltransferase [Chitinophagaceae bacterium]|nr:UbiA family prenyltransferase [Chitinophagaceae bacterium]
MKNSVLYFFDLFFLIRPILLVPVWGFSLFGYYRAKTGSLTQITSFWKTTPLEVYVILIIFSISVGAVYIFNQIADIEVDKNNGGLPLIASGVISPKNAIVFSIFLSVISLLLPLLTNYKSISILSASTLLIGILYSFKPFYFSGKPFLDFLSNATGYGIIAFGAGWVCGGKDIATIHFLYCALPYFFLMCAGSISSTLPDTKGDSLVGKNTTAVVFGHKRSHIFATLILVTAAIIAYIQSDQMALLCSLISLPLYLAYLIKPTTLLMESTYKVGGAISMICACMILPLIIPAAIVVYFCTWLYFRIRHGVSYPSLVVVSND